MEWIATEETGAIRNRRCLDDWVSRFDEPVAVRLQGRDFKAEVILPLGIWLDWIRDEVQLHFIIAH